VNKIPLRDIFSQLDQLASSNLLSHREAIIEWVLRQLLPLEVKWLIRILLKDLKIGFAAKSILDEWHPDAYQVWMTSSDFSAIATLSDRSYRVPKQNMSIQCMTPFRPMFCLGVKKFHYLPDRLAGLDHPFWCQEKVDGERMLIHYSKGNFKFHSRNLKDWTMDFGINLESGSWARHIKGIFAPEIDEFILDGEMVACDAVSGAVHPFGTLRSAQRVDAENLALVSSHPRFYCFDLLRLGPNTLENYPLKQRYNALSKCFTEKKDWFEILPIKECNDANEVLALLYEQYLQKGEGLVIKDPSSAYLPGERCHRWLKLKMDYEIEYMETIDCLVVGGSWGEGLRSGHFSSLCLAVKDSRPGSDTNEQWISLVRVGSGLSMFLMQEITSQLMENMIDLTSSTCPEWLQLPLNAKEKPDCVIKNIEDSIVLEITAAEIQKSDTWPSGGTLRFPRVVRWRQDKSHLDVISMGELLDLWEETQGRLVKRPPTDVLNMPMRSKKTSRPSKNSRKPLHSFVPHAVSSQFTPIFNDKCFLICAGLSIPTLAPSSVSISSAYLQSMIQEHGGRVIANLNRDGDYDKSHEANEEHLIVVADDVNRHSVRLLQQLQKYDIIKAGHILLCLHVKTWVEPKPNDYFFMSEKTRASLHLKFDCWGDSYTDFIHSNEEMEILLKEMDSLWMNRVYPLNAEDNDRKILAQEEAPAASASVVGMRYDGIDADDVLLGRYSAEVLGFETEIVQNRKRKLKQIAGLRYRYFNDINFPFRWFTYVDVLCS
jgi:DNA ligase-4